MFVSNMTYRRKRDREVKAIKRAIERRQREEEAEEETDEEEVQEEEEAKKEETHEKFLDVCKKEDEKKGKK